MRSVKLRDSKFGQALVVETSAESGGYVLGFRLETEDEGQRLQKQIASMRAASLRHPTFGVDLQDLTPHPTPPEVLPADGHDTSRPLPVIARNDAWCAA